MFALDSADRQPNRISLATIAPGRLAGGVARSITAERRRWLLWFPVLEGIGVGLYFTARGEPPSWLGGLTLVMAAAISIGAAYMAKGRRGAVTLSMIALALALVATGFTAAQYQTFMARAPVLAVATPPLRFQGVVGDIDVLPEGCRIGINHPIVEDLSPAETPRMIRLKSKICPNAVGDQVWGRALLFPPPAPMFPGGYDFQRLDFFQGIGATGFTLGWLGDDPALTSTRPDRLMALRHEMTQRIMAALPGADGGVAAALITGEKTGIPAEVAQDFRDSGLAHMLVIAGLHMSLVTGFVFFACRAGLALIPAIALRYPIKKIAAIASLIAAMAYLAVSGGAVPTQRAFIMCLLGIVAILFDRSVFSMRGLALAALAILTTNPVALMGVSFQMSFAAVVALISFYESASPMLANLGMNAGPWRRGVLHLFGIALTTVVATIATIPFTIYHFGRFALYSVLANVVAVPLAGLWILPWALVGCLLMPFHLEALALRPMGWGIDVVRMVAHWTANLPRDVIILPAMPDADLLVISLGGLWIALWRERWRWLGLVPIVAAVAVTPLASPPDLFVADDGRLVAVRGSDDQLYLSSSRRDKMAAESWESAAGTPQEAPFPETGSVPTHHGNWDCDAGACVWQWGTRKIILELEKLGGGDACPSGDLVVSVYRLPDVCRDGQRIFDPATTQAWGAQTIWLGDPPIIRGTRAERGARPWIPVNNDASTPRDGLGP